MKGLEHLAKLSIEDCQIKALKPTENVLQPKKTTGDKKSPQAAKPVSSERSSTNLEQCGYLKTLVDVDEQPQHFSTADQAASKEVKYADELEL